jgi:hypothetical protein
LAAAPPQSPPRAQGCASFCGGVRRAARERGGITDPIRYGKTFTLVHDPL